MAAALALPDLGTLDVDALRSLLLAKHSELVAQQERLLSRDNEIEHLKLVIAKLRRMIFGAKSERATREIEQLELKLEELEAVRADHHRDISQEFLQYDCCFAGNQAIPAGPGRPFLPRSI